MLLTKQIRGDRSAHVAKTDESDAHREYSYA
jgi:hypothetical protein